jgi:LPXTG-motif cell wall-anchored protein
MWSKIKNAGTAILGFLVLVLGGFLFASRRKNEGLESDLANAQNESKTKDVDHAREIAKKEAADLLASYESAKRDYDSDR